MTADEEARALEARAAADRRERDRQRRLRLLAGDPAARRALEAKTAPLTRLGVPRAGR